MLAQTPPVIRRSCGTCPVRTRGIFAELSQGQIATIDNAKTVNDYQKGQVLYYEGHHPVAAYCVVAGHIKLFRSGPGQTRRILRLVGPGELFGHEALFRSEPYAGTAQAMDDCRICLMPRDAFLPAVVQNPQVLLRVTERICADLLAAERSAADLSAQPVRVRLARVLLCLATRFGRPSSEGIQLPVPLSRGELAEMAGTRTETAIRMLNEWRREAILAIEHRSITVKKREALEKLAA